MPSTSLRVLAALGFEEELPPWPEAGVRAEMETLPAGRGLGELGILFAKIQPEEVAELEAEFGGE